MVNTASLYFISSLLILTKSDLSCTGSGGCGQYATCDYEFVPNGVYGCGGEWTNNGVSNGAYLCGDGYSICPNAQRASTLNLTLELCLSESITEDYYYVSLAGADSNAGKESSTCVDGGINNLFGCTNPNTDFVETSSIDCGPLGAMLTTQTSNNGEGWREGWEPWADPWDELDEVEATRHLKPQDADYNRLSYDKGGVLCCKDPEGATPNPTSQPTTAIPTQSPIYFTPPQEERINKWKSRAVYQILTDRFARDDDDDTDCTDLSKYCGGNFQGIIDKLDYIEGLGYDTIWISPVVENTKDGYHGYWAKDIYSINPYFGTEQDLLDLVDALHSRDMYLMIDIVVNHMGRRNTSAALNYSYDYSGFTPFDSNEHYHDSCNLDVCDEYCSITNFNYYSDEGLEEVEKCRLSGLPDLNQSNPEVSDLLCSWIKDYVQDKWMADALRLDTVPEVAIDHWDYLLSSECVNNRTFIVGEFFWGDPAILGPYQPVMDSLFGYPMYYTLRDVFGSNQYGMGNIAGRLYEYEQNFIDYAALGLFTDNHDNPRWLCDFDDMTNYKNALLFMHTFPGIPYGYYGTEQGFDGCDDPENREALWKSDYDTESDLYVFIATVNRYRKGLEIYDGEFTQLWEEDDLYAFSRGDNALIILSNSGESFNRTINAYTLKSGTFCNVFDTSDTNDFLDCFVKSDDEQLIDIDQGAGKFYVAVDDIPIVTTIYYESTNIETTDIESTDIEATDIEATNYESTIYESIHYASTEYLLTDYELTDDETTESTNYESTESTENESSTTEYEIVDDTSPNESGDENTTEDVDKSQAGNRVYFGIYAVFMIILMTLYNF